MTLQAGDKLMSLTDVSEMLGIPVLLPCTAGGTRATASRLPGGPSRAIPSRRLSRLGWNSGSTSASDHSARTGRRMVHNA